MSNRENPSDPGYSGRARIYDHGRIIDDDLPATPLLYSQETVRTYGLGKLGIDQTDAVPLGQYLLYNAVHRCLFTDTTEILVEMGGPATGKSTTASEKAALIVHEFRKAGLTEREIADRFMFIEFENVIELYKNILGRIDPDARIGTFTQEDYENLFQPTFQQIILSAITKSVPDAKGKMILIETPNYARRGEVTDILNHDGFFAGLAYTVSATAYTHGPGLFDIASDIRRKFGEATVRTMMDRIHELLRSGVYVVYNDPEDHVGGGDLFAIMQYYMDESEILFQDVWTEIFGNIFPSDAVRQYYEAVTLSHIAEQFEHNITAIDSGYRLETEGESIDPVRYILTHEAEAFFNKDIRTWYMETIRYPLYFGNETTMDPHFVHLVRNVVGPQIRPVFYVGNLDRYRFIDTYDNPEEWNVTLETK